MRPDLCRTGSRPQRWFSHDEAHVIFAQSSYGNISKKKSKYVYNVVYVHIGVFVEQDITHMHKFDPEPNLMFRLSIRLGVGS